VRGRGSCGALGTPDGGAVLRRPVALVAHPFADRYGSDRMVLESVRALVDAGWRVVVTMPEGGPLVAMVEETGAGVVLCPTPRLAKSALKPRGFVALVGQTVRGTRRGWALLRSLRPDAVYVNTLTIPWWIVLARLRRVPVLCHVHEAERSASWLLRTALSLPLLLVTTVVANSRFAVEVVADSFPRAARRSRIVDNGVAGPPGRTRARPALEPPVKLVYVGRLSARKGVDVAVVAVGALRDRGVHVELDVVGAVFPGYEWYQEELEGLVARLELTDRVHLHGFQDPAWPFYAAADVVLVPSRTDEPFGNTAVEAVLSARPVVASGSGGLVEATEGYRSARTVPAGDPGALADAVEEVVASWSTVRSEAWDDARRAEARHAPALYRSRIVEIVAGMAGVQGR
jgi:glycosyltransferase involved in cell wall biosynthesis